MSKYQFVFHPSMRKHIEEITGAQNLRGQDYMTQQLLIQGEISYVQDIRITRSEPQWLDAYSEGAAAGLFAEYPRRSMLQLASGRGG